MFFVDSSPFVSSGFFPNFPLPSSWVLLVFFDDEKQGPSGKRLNKRVTDCVTWVWLQLASLLDKHTGFQCLFLMRQKLGKERELGFIFLLLQLFSQNRPFISFFSPQFLSFHTKYRLFIQSVFLIQLKKRMHDSSVIQCHSSNSLVLL